MYILSHRDRQGGYLTDGVDGRIGHLGEELFEIIEDHARLVGHH